MMNKYLPIICLCLIATTASAQEYYDFNKRSGKWELSLFIQQTGDQTVDFTDTLSLDVDSQTGWGFQFGYNFDQHWNLSFAVDSYKADYRTRGIVDKDGNPADFTHEMNSFSGQFNATYHFMTGRFTPYIEAGLGWTYLDSNISNGRYYYNCGFYYCYYYGDTYDDSSFSYHTGAGLRYEFENKVFIKAGYAIRWVDMDSPNNTSDVDYGRIELGFLM
jgi:opacity protein-like surface antigen